MRNQQNPHLQQTEGFTHHHAHSSTMCSENTHTLHAWHKPCYSNLGSPATNKGLMLKVLTLVQHRKYLGPLMCVCFAAQNTNRFTWQTCHWSLHTVLKVQYYIGQEILCCIFLRTWPLTSWRQWNFSYQWFCIVVTSGRITAQLHICDQSASLYSTEVMKESRSVTQRSVCLHTVTLLDAVACELQQGAEFITRAVWIQFKRFHGQIQKQEKNPDTEHKTRMW